MYTHCSYFVIVISLFWFVSCVQSHSGNVARKRKIITFLVACECMNVSHAHEKVSHAVRCLICKSVCPRTLCAPQAKQNYHRKQSMMSLHLLTRAFKNLQGHKNSWLQHHLSLYYPVVYLLSVDCYIGGGGGWNKRLISALFQCYRQCSIRTHTHTDTQPIFAIQPYFGLTVIICQNIKTQI